MSARAVIRSWMNFGSDKFGVYRPVLGRAIDQSFQRESHREEVIRSLSGRCQYWLFPDVAQYRMTAQSLIKMMPEQQREVVSSLRKPDYQGLRLRKMWHRLWHTNTLIVTLSVMWNKASELLSTQNAITPAQEMTPRQEWSSLVRKMYHTMFVVTLTASICTPFDQCN